MPAGSAASEDESDLALWRTKWNWRSPRDGRTVLALSPLEFLGALGRLIPPPRIHRDRYHGVLAPNARLDFDFDHSAGA